jgi:hypothetical protein
MLDPGHYLCCLLLSDLPAMVPIQCCNLLFNVYIRAAESEYITSANAC